MSEFDAGVLVVDDELFFREAIRDVLTGDDLDVTLASTGEEGLELAADTRIGVVVLDIRLPDIDGIEVLRRLRELRPALRVIMLSASVDQELVLQALRLGANDYLAKPLHDEELLLAVRRALDSFAVANDWNRLRGRLDRLAGRMEELASRVDTEDPEERMAWVQQAVTVAASEVLEAERTSLLMLEPDGESLRVVASVGHEMKPEELDAMSLRDGIAGLVLQRGEPLVVGDVDSHPDYADLVQHGRYDSPSFALAPLIGRSGPFGLLCVTERADGGRFGGEDLALLRLMAVQIADRIEPPPAAEGADDVGFADDVTHVVEPATPEDSGAVTVVQLDEGEADRDVELAREICLAIVDEVEPARVIDAALRPLSAKLPAAPASLYLLDTGSGELRREGECDGGVSGDHEVLPADRGLTGIVLQTGCVVATDDPASHPRFDAGVDTPENGQVRPLLVLPLQLRGKVIGVFRAFLEEGASASARTGEVVSAALSAAVRSALLYRSLVESIEEVAEARRAARR